VGEAIHTLNRSGMMPKELTYEEYGKYWTTLLHVEQIQEE
jgi:hypothetical protein